MMPIAKAIDCLAEDRCSLATADVLRVARCHAPMKARNIATDTTAARSLSDDMRQLAFLILKLPRYSSGLAGSKVLPITAKLFVVVVGGVMPTSFISLAVSVER